MTSVNKNKKKCSMGTRETCMFGNTQLYTAKFVKQRFFLVLIVGFFYLQSTRNELSGGQEICSINSQAIIRLLVLREGVSELLFAPTTSTKRIWRKTTDTK